MRSNNFHALCTPYLSICSFAKGIAKLQELQGKYLSILKDMRVIVNTTLIVLLLRSRRFKIVPYKLLDHR